MRPIIEVRGVSKRYQLGAIGATSLREEFRRTWDQLRGVARVDTKEFWALRDVSFDVQPGEVVGIIGRNGAGKSTLLKILSRITEPTSGTIRLRGRMASLLEVGTGFHPELSGRENIYLNGAILGMDRAEVTRKFDEIVAFAEIDQFIDTPVKRYSSGMYVRLAFAVAAHLEPEILVIDEVLAVGDVQFQQKCLGKMREVSNRSGRTVLFVSHNMEAVGSLCSRGIVLEKGALSFVGPASAAIKRYDDQGAHVGRTWTGPLVDSDVTLERTWIKPRHADAALESAESLEIGLQFEIHRDLTGLVLGYQLVSEFGAELVYSLHDDAAPQPARVTPGRYIKRFVIPANTLAAGFYRVHFDVGLHNLRRIVSSPAGDLAFDLNNISGIGRHYLVGHSRGFKSLLRPAWPVETERVD